MVFGVCTLFCYVRSVYTLAIFYFFEYVKMGGFFFYLLKFGVIRRRYVWKDCTLKIEWPSIIVYLAIRLGII